MLHAIHPAFAYLRYTVARYTITCKDLDEIDEAQMVARRCSYLLDVMCMFHDPPRPSSRLLSVLF
jgi:hypothetical protein